MASVIDKLCKRRFYPFQLHGETVYLRAMTFGEIKLAYAIENELASNGYIIGCCLMNPDGSQAFERSASESPKEFGDRILNECPDLSTDTVGDIIEVVMRLNKSPGAEALAKNS